MKFSNEKKRVFVLKYEVDVIGVFDNEHEAELVAFQDKIPPDLWLIEETTYYYTKEAA